MLIVATITPLPAMRSGNALVKMQSQRQINALNIWETKASESEQAALDALI